MKDFVLSVLKPFQTDKTGITTQIVLNTPQPVELFNT
jgi:hypothetical protein